MTDYLPTLIILAGGSSSRLWPLREKSLLRFMDVPLLEHQLLAYIELGFNRVVVVCNADNHDAISKILAKHIQQIEFHTFIQAQARGMGDALLTLEPLLSEKNESIPVYICQVHDVFDQRLHLGMLQAFQSDPRTTWLAAYQVASYFPGGYLVVDEGQRITNIIEKPQPGTEPSDLVNIVAHIHPDLRLLLARINAEYDKDNPNDDHYERAMAQLMIEHPFTAVPYSGVWTPIKYPWHVLSVMNYYLSTMQKHIAEDVIIEDDVHISGLVYIENGVKILHGADIRGPAYIGAGCVVGQYANIRQSMIGQHSVVGFRSEVNRSYLGQGVHLHAGTALDSVLADSTNVNEHINLSAGAITANFRADAGNVKSTVKGARIDTGLTKLGAIIGAGSFIGINAMLMPGVKIGENCVIGPGTIVLEDIPNHTQYYAEQQCINKSVPRQ